MAMESVIFSELASHDNKSENDKQTLSLDVWYNLFRCAELTPQADDAQNTA